jgi:phenylacetate-CoA ligase
LNKIKLFALNYLPIFLQNILISLFNTYQYKVRHRGQYRAWKKYYNNYMYASKVDLKCEQEKRLNNILRYAKENSSWYKDIDIDCLSYFAILLIVSIIYNLLAIATIPDIKAIVCHCGGTTGASMKVLFKEEDVQERYAILDTFREKYGYKLGKKTAWFSGKSIVSAKDINRGVCYRDDLINKIRFFSTFHINNKNFESYWDSLVRFMPEFIVGFPSSVYEICKIAELKKLKFPGTVKVFFPTAETVLAEHRIVINKVLGCKVIDQYSASEGAPFIIECTSSRLHIHPLTGIFEVIDELGNHSEEGSMYVTSFSTKGTPLIRYDIGDRIKLSKAGLECDCGLNFPLVDRIEGRTADYIFSPENGKVNLGNISNCTKGIEGIQCFQIIQDVKNEIEVKVVANDRFTSYETSSFIGALKERLGNEMVIKLAVVSDIPKEKSGKFRIVKNNIQ